MLIKHIVALKWFINYVCFKYLNNSNSQFFFFIKYYYMTKAVKKWMSKKFAGEW